MKFPIGISDYKRLQLDNYASVDKTLFIKEFLDDGSKVFIITRPRRFGKTSNLSMLKYFLDIENAEENRKLFEGTKIYTAKLNNGEACINHQGQYPVIFITLKDLKSSSYTQMQQEIEAQFSDMYMQYYFLIEGENANLLNPQEKQVFIDVIKKQANEAELKSSIKKLTEYLHRYSGKPVVLLLDEYDTPMHSAYSAREPYHNQMLEFMTGLLSGLLKDNSSLHRGILTGILRISLMNLFSGVNSVPVCSMLSREYAEYFGFKEAEVDLLFKQAGLTQNSDEIKAWYNGYQIDGVTLYNPWSIISCLRSGGKVDTYWLQSGNSGIVGKALIISASSDILPKLQKLLDGGSIKVRFDERTIFENIETNEDALWSIMLYTGYLKPIKIWNEDTAKLAELQLPNKEIKSGIESIILNWTDFPKTGGSVYNQILQSLASDDITALGDILQQYIYETVSFYDFDRNTTERMYHVFLLGMCLTLKDKFIIDSNKEVGRGRFDIILIPREKGQRGVIIELKRLRVTSSSRRAELKADLKKVEAALDELADEALAQIMTQEYHAKFTQHGITQIANIALAFYGKETVLKFEMTD